MLTEFVTFFTLTFSALSLPQLLPYWDFPAPSSASFRISARSQIIASNPTPVVEAGAAATTSAPLQSFGKRDNSDCIILPLGAGPVPDVDTPEAFVADNDFSSAATSAKTPSGYVNSFTNFQASSQAQGYLGYATLPNYDVDSCAAACTNTFGCLAFNIYFERNPIVIPDTPCPDPPSTTVIKCVFWSGQVTPDNALTYGQWRYDFHVVIAGSNGYVNNLSHEVAGWNSFAYGTGAINALLDCHGVQTYMGYKYYNDGKPYDPARCAVACAAQNDYSLAWPPADGNVQLCRFFNSYVLNKNDVPQGQVCSMYTRTWPTSYATNMGQWRDSDHYTISMSLGYENLSLSSSACLPAGDPQHVPTVRRL